MEKIFEKIQELEGVSSLSKHEQLVQGIINAIDEKIVVKGDTLPSVNNMIKELKFARETIAKAYKELIHRGIIESKNRLGYFVATEDTEQELKVALVLFTFDSIQETFYENFRQALGKKVHMDIFFHHGNFTTFETTIENIKGKYGMYVIAPIPDKRTPNLLKTLPQSRFLMIDRYVPIDGEFSYIVQEFKNASYDAFHKLLPKIKNFDEMVFLYKPESFEPVEILESFREFTTDNNITATVKTEYKPGSLEKGKVYFTIHNQELWAMLKDIKSKGIELGSDIGIISHNDDMVKEIIFNGVTTFSTDFALMGKKAAEFVLKRKKIQEVLPTVLIERNSI
ncbi:GntR family transcriptional regulator [Zhouia sp. PK063]|uniref:GntR family transcriptional regulator n=1 Tax=Zhouia sp. PK063 TaxID=3373602 RepID=UPI0037A5E6F4